MDGVNAKPSAIEVIHRNYPTGSVVHVEDDFVLRIDFPTRELVISLILYTQLDHTPLCGEFGVIKKAKENKTKSK